MYSDYHNYHKTSAQFYFNTLLEYLTNYKKECEEAVDCAESTISKREIEILDLRMRERAARQEASDAESITLYLAMRIWCYENNKLDLLAKLDEAFRKAISEVSPADLPATYDTLMQFQKYEDPEFLISGCIKDGVFNV